MTLKTHKNRFKHTILQAMGIEIDRFNEALQEQRNYELLLDQWINKLYIRKKTDLEAQQLIFKARRIYYLKFMDTCKSGKK